MYAVVKTGGKQYRVVPGDVIEVEKLPAEAGTIIELGEVLMLGGEGAPQIGAPRIEGAAVTATVLEQLRDDTILVFKKKRRHNYRRKRGHRQYLTVLRIAEILPPGAARTVTQPAMARPRKAKPAEPVAEAKGEALPKAAAKKPAAKKAPAKKAAPKKAAAAGTKKAKASAKSGGARKTTKAKKSEE